MTTTIVVKSGASILLTNLPEHPHKDKDDDFLLHYLVFDDIPATVTIPHETSCLQAPPDEPIGNGGIELFTGPGCANSGFP